MVMDFVRNLSKSSIRAGIANNIPSIAKGMINEFFTLANITPETVIPMVENKESLWQKLRPEDITKLSKILDQIDNLDWLTEEWLLNAIVEKHNALVSLFVKWRKGQNWLKKQVEEIKSNTENLRNNESDG